MKTPPEFSRPILCIIVVVLGIFSAYPLFAQISYEGPVTLTSASLLPAELQKSDLFNIEKNVTNDGFINNYVVHYGDQSFQVSSNIGLYKLILEIRAIEAMKQVEESDAFVSALKESGVATVNGIKQLFTDPGDTLESAAAGFNSLFARAEESLFNSSPGETEDSRLEQTVGFSNAKRDIAFRYKVDVYSDNALLQEHLDRLAWAEYAGGLTLSVVSMPIGGAVGVTLSVSGTAKLLGEVVATLPPAELKLQNRAKLIKMGIDENLINLFIEIPHMSPLQQTAFVMALEKMNDVQDKSLPLQAALQIADQEMARYMTTIMVMQAGYSKHIQPVVKFKTVAKFFCGVNRDGKLIVILPADYITLNKRLVTGTSNVQKEEIKGYELWTLGTVSPAAQEFIEGAGWKLEQQVATKIGFKIKKQ
jgi:hypothetical protein